MDLTQAHRLALMALDMTEQPGLQHTVDRIVSNAQQSIACDALGVVLVRDGAIQTASSTDEQVRLADDLQVRCQEGPCLPTSEPPTSSEPDRSAEPAPPAEPGTSSEAGRSTVPSSSEVIVIEDVAGEDRWPRWCAKAAELGWRSMLSVRLATPLRPLGSLNLYSRAAHAFTADDVELAQIFGRHASVALMGAHYSDSLRAAVSSRHMIGQAQGILMERYQVDADRAFTVLRRYSQERNVKLRLIAEQVISTHRLPD